MYAIFPLTPHQLVEVGATCERLDITHSGIHSVPFMPNYIKPPTDKAAGQRISLNNGHDVLLPYEEVPDRYLVEFRNPNDFMLFKLAFERGAA